MARLQVDIQSEDQVGARWVDTQAEAPQWTGIMVGAQWDLAKLQLHAQRGPAGVNFILACGIMMVVIR